MLRIYVHIQMSLSPTPTPECCFVFQEHVALCACVLLSDPPPCLGTSGVFLIMGGSWDPESWDCSFEGTQGQLSGALGKSWELSGYLA